MLDKARTASVAPSPRGSACTAYSHGMNRPLTNTAHGSGRRHGGRKRSCRHCVAARVCIASGARAYLPSLHVVPQLARQELLWNSRVQARRNAHAVAFRFGGRTASSPVRSRASAPRSPTMPQLIRRHALAHRIMRGSSERGSGCRMRASMHESGRVRVCVQASGCDTHGARVSALLACRSPAQCGTGYSRR